MILLSCNPGRWLAEDVAVLTMWPCYRAAWIGRLADVSQLGDWEDCDRGHDDAGRRHGPGVGDTVTPFRYEAQAQRHCPGDKVVWLDFRKGVYYRQKLYGQGFDGSFVCETEVRDSLYRRSPLGLR